MLFTHHATFALSNTLTQSSLSPVVLFASLAVSSCTLSFRLSLSQSHSHSIFSPSPSVSLHCILLRASVDLLVIEWSIAVCWVFSIGSVYVLLNGACSVFNLYAGWNDFMLGISFCICCCRPSSLHKCVCTLCACVFHSGLLMSVCVCFSTSSPSHNFRPSQQWPWLIKAFFGATGLNLELQNVCVCVCVCVYCTTQQRQCSHLATLMRHLAVFLLLAAAFDA